MGKEKLKKIITFELCMLIIVLAGFAFTIDKVSAIIVGDIKYVEATPVSSTSLRVEWDPVKNAENYSIFYRSSKNEKWNRLEVPGETTGIYLDDLKKNSDYEIKVKAYSDEYDKSRYMKINAKTASVENTNIPTFKTIEDAGTYFREQMKLRNEVIQFYYKGEMKNDIAEELFAEAVKHTKVPTEGDYIRFQEGGCYKSINGNKITFVLKYYTTLKKEKLVDNKIKKIINELKLDGLSDYDKVKAIHKYMCKNVDYDVLQYDDNDIKRSCYAAAIRENAVCQGYAVMFYRLCLETGIDSRVIYGHLKTEFGEGPHTWNIVKIDGKYYNIDLTSDSTSSFRDDFIMPKCPEFDEKHIVKDVYAENEFWKDYDMATEEYSKK